MLIASWNVNSIRSRLEQVINWLIATNADVLCLQETKVIDKEFPFESFERLGYQVKVYGQKSYNGVAIISKSDIENVKFGFLDEIEGDETIDYLETQKRIISAIVNGVRIINIYVPNGSSIPSDKFDFKIEWLKNFKKYISAQQQRNELTCITGDFNIAPTDQDIHAPESYRNKIMASELERKMLEDIVKGRFIDSFRVFEKNSGFWSWWDYRNRAFDLNKGWRIDHIYICNGLLPKLKSAVIQRSERGNTKPSDHAPVIINLDLDKNDQNFEDEDDDFFLL